MEKFGEYAYFDENNNFLLYLQIVIRLIVGGRKNRFSQIHQSTSNALRRSAKYQVWVYSTSIAHKPGATASLLTDRTHEKVARYAAPLTYVLQFRLGKGVVFPKPYIGHVLAHNQNMLPRFLHTALFTTNVRYVTNKRIGSASGSRQYAETQNATGFSKRR